MIHPHNDVENIAHFDRRSHNDPLGTPVQVALNGFWRQEFACALQHHIHPHVAPRDFGSGGMGAEGESFGPDQDRFFTFGTDVFAPLALHRIKCQQVCRCFGSAFEFVQVHHLQPVARTGVV